MNNKFSIGMRFKMRFEGDGSLERRYIHIIKDICHFLVCFRSLNLFCLCIAIQCLDQVLWYYRRCWRYIFGLARLKVAFLEGKFGSKISDMLFALRYLSNYIFFH